MLRCVAGRIVATAVFATALGMPAAALARTDVQVRGEPSDLTFAGRDVVFADAIGRHNRIERVDPRGRVHVPRGVNRLANRKRDQAVELAASSSLLALAVAHDTCYVDEDTSNESCFPDFIEFAAGRLGATPRVFRRCRNPGHDLRGTDIAVSGTRVVYLECRGASDAGARAVVRDLAHPDAAPLVLPTPDGPYIAVAAAGGFVAAYAPGSYVAGQRNSYPNAAVIVFDGSSGRELYSIGDPAGSWALQADGEIAIAPWDFGPGAPQQSGCAGPLRLAWASPGEPWPHYLPYEPCSGVAQLADDRILFDVAPTPYHSQLAVTSTAAATPLAVTAVVGSPRYEAVFDGTRLAYSDETCTGYRIVLDDLSYIAAHGYRKSDRCPIRFARSAPVAQEPTGLLRIRARCPRGCQGSIEFRVHGHRRELTTGTDGDFHIRRHELKTLREDALVDTLHPHRRLSRRRAIDITLVAYQPDGSTVTRTVTRRLLVP